MKKKDDNRNKGEQNGDDDWNYGGDSNKDDYQWNLRLMVSDESYYKVCCNLWKEGV